MAVITWFYTVQQGEVITSEEVETTEETRAEVEAAIEAARVIKYGE